ncbi:hypothetical protein IQ250_06020 [Pseudanabaenaceae cyanobacterium LEGE 13415]|nr:hypothetical protein [Pseudanabaenaceae cyanobacterium LEGE 13415]
MTDVEHWQEQERRAAEILPILEQTLDMAKAWNLLEQTNQGWRYGGEAETLIYNPESEQLSVFANDRSWRLDWHEGLFVRSAETLITDEQLTEFRELATWLQAHEADLSQPSEAELCQPQSEMLLSSAARLFEYYASQGDTAFKFSSNSTEHFYRVQIENEVYLISRDDASGLYSLQHEDERAFRATDMRGWQQIETWLQQLAEQPLEQAPHAAAPYWEQQTIQANAVLLDAQALFTFYEQLGTVKYNSTRHSYVAAIGNYTIGYTPSSDVFWLERNDNRLVSANQYQQHQRNGRSHWHLTELQDLGNITPEDVRRLREWRTWLMMQSEWEPGQSLQEQQSGTQQPTKEFSPDASSQQRSHDDLDR